MKRYISFDSLIAAERFGQKLFSKQIILGTHPEIGRIVPEIADPSIREIVVGNYRVMYI
ncbi:MAG: type II toxin-antitoxin system RelE/ParE family toxin [Chthoniobacterales bacterium]